MNAQSSIPPPDTRAAGRRRASRLRLGIPAVVVLVTGQFRCRLDNLSQSGARLALGDATPVIGASALLKINGIEGLGTIVWTSGPRFGLAFDEPLTLDEVVSVRHFAEAYARLEAQKQLRNARDFVQGRRSSV